MLAVIIVPDRKVVMVRLRDYELLELNAFSQSLGIPSRSRLVNLALQQFLQASPKPELHANRLVKLRIDSPLQKRLAEMSKLLGTTCTEIIRMALRDFMGHKTLASAGYGQVEFFRDDEREEYSSMKAQLVKALKRMEGHNPAFDLPLVEEISRSAIYVKRGEQYLDDPACAPETYAAVSDAMAKQAARMRTAIRDLAANRAERLKAKSASNLAAEIRKAVDKVVGEG